MLKIPEAPPAPRRRPKLWPTSLGARTLLTLLLGLALVQAAGLTIHAYDRIGLQHQADARDIGMRAMGIYRSVVSTSVSERATALKDLDLGPGTRAALSDGPPLEPSDPTPDELARSIRVSMALVQVRPQNHWHELQMRGIPWDSGGVTIGFLLPEEHAGWLDVSIAVPPPRPWHSPTFLWAFVVMTLCAAALSFWAVRQLTGPVATLAGAAEALGRDVNAPPLPEGGPDEVARAALAFNTMASRIRRFVQDRTFLLAAIGHDLRTPITRLKLRAEFIDDDELRDKFLADLDELDTMVSATLAFGRDTSDMEPAVPMDLAALLRVILDETADARPDSSDGLVLEGSPHVTLRGRPVALKRAFANLIGNAVKYGSAARVSVAQPEPGIATITVEDDGPGVPPEQLERVFDPFYRVEDSRNRETGGTGLGLPIARNIFRAHGGDVVLANRAGGGARATVTLPV
jgi:signal transduction histidine kinase